MGIDWRLLCLLRLVESEAVVAAVPGSLELLQEEEDSVVDHAQHAQSTDSCGGGAGFVRSGISFSEGDTEINTKHE